MFLGMLVRNLYKVELHCFGILFPNRSRLLLQLQIYKTMACSTNIFMGHGNFYLEISRHGKHKRSRVSCLYVREPLFDLF